MIYLLRAAVGTDDQRGGQARLDRFRGRGSARYSSVCSETVNMYKNSIADPEGISATFSRASGPPAAAAGAPPCEPAWRSRPLVGPRLRLGLAPCRGIVTPWHSA